MSLIVTLGLLLLLIPTQAPVISSPVGTGEQGDSGDGGPAARAKLNQPFDVAFDRQGHLFFSDTGNHKIRRVDGQTGRITTVAGTGRKGFSGDGGPAVQADLDEPYGLAIDRQGNIYFADRLNFRVRRIDAATRIITTLAGTGEPAHGGDGGPASQAAMVEPNGVALDPEETRLYIADVAGHRIRVVELATGRIETAIGNGQGRRSADPGPIESATLQGPRAVEVDRQGRLLVLERNGHSLRRADFHRGVIETIAGTGEKGYTGDGGHATEATFDGPKELALDSQGNILIVDTENQTIRRIDAQTGLIRTVTGSGHRGGQGDGGPATEAQLDRPHGVAIGPDGAIYIGDTNNHRIRRVAQTESPQSP